MKTTRARTTPKSTQSERDAHLEAFILPYVVSTFERHPTLTSAAMCLSHFAGCVNICFVWSERYSPDIDMGLICEHNGEADKTNLPNTPPGVHFAVGHVDYKRADLGWFPRDSAVEMYACFCREEEPSWSQATSPMLTTLPYAIFRRQTVEGGEEAAVTGYALNPKKERPDLDGITAAEYEARRKTLTDEAQKRVRDQELILGESPKASDIPLTTMIVLGPLSAERRKSISAAMSHLVGLCLGADMCFPVADPSLDGGMLS